MIGNDARLPTTLSDSWASRRVLRSDDVWWPDQAACRPRRPVRLRLPLQLQPGKWSCSLHVRMRQQKAHHRACRQAVRRPSTDFVPLQARPPRVAAEHLVCHGRCHDHRRYEPMCRRQSPSIFVPAAHGARTPAAGPGRETHKIAKSETHWAFDIRLEGLSPGLTYAHIPVTAFTRPAN